MQKMAIQGFQQGTVQVAPGRGMYHPKKEKKKESQGNFIAGYLACLIARQPVRSNSPQYCEMTVG